MRELTELDKLEKYLIEHRIEHNRYDVNRKWEPTTGLVIEMDRHQICVPEEGERCKWDAICQRGSYGYEQGLLEIYGEIVDAEKDGDTVVGYLTAEDVIKRLEGQHMSTILAFALGSFLGGSFGVVMAAVLMADRDRR